MTPTYLEALAIALNHPGAQKVPGGIARNMSSGASAYGAAAASVLLRNNGSFIWDMDDPINGEDLYDSIFEYMAAEAYAPGGKTKHRIAAAKDFANNMRTGVKTLADWLDAKYEYPLFRCTSSGTSLITAITGFPDEVIDSITGITAIQSQMARDTKLMEGHVKSSVKRLSRVNDLATVKQLMQDTVDTAIAIPPPKGSRVEDIPVLPSTFVEPKKKSHGLFG